MSSNYTWRALPLGVNGDVPTLLASIQLGTAAYTVRVTDTANIWAESLERRQICMRAWGENTSIDPSDTPENMSKFLDSLRSALDPSHQDHGLTSMSLSPAGPSGDDADGLILNITCELPGLSPLKWPVQLKKEPSSSLARNLVLPLVQGQYTRAHEVEVLTEMLSQKDAIITKLLDKLESTGTGLEHVFNTLSSKKKVSRATAEAKVKGLAPFDQSSWRSNSLKSAYEPENTVSLLTNVFGGDGLDLNMAFEDESSTVLDGWWHSLKGTVQIPHRTQTTKSEQKQEKAPPVSSAEAEDDDDFQAQPSSPAVAASKASAKPQDLDDMSTASESGQDEPDDKSHITKIPTQPATGKIGRIGGIGSRKQVDETLSSSAVGKSKSATEPEGSDTATDASDNEGGVRDVPASPPAQSKSNVPARGKIGRIGGRSATSVFETEPALPRQISEDSPDVSRPSHAPKLGMIGKGSKKGSTADLKDENDERGRNPQATEPSHRETSTERADRRREELKRDLEKKAAAGPTKKKRKF
jgi:hypothetical protein